MSDVGSTFAIVYAAGVVWGSVRTDAGPGTRAALALLWPIGPVAFVLTVGMLLLVAPIALLGRRT
jgi:hypothetical protein